jgi:hypothetical protein
MANIHTLAIILVIWQLKPFSGVKNTRNQSLIFLDHILQLNLCGSITYIMSDQTIFPLEKAKGKYCYVISKYGTLDSLHYSDVPGADKHDSSIDLCNMYANMVCVKYGSDTYECGKSRWVASKASSARMGHHHDLQD